MKPFQRAVNAVWKRVSLIFVVLSPVFYSLFSQLLNDALNGSWAKQSIDMSTVKSILELCPFLSICNPFMNGYHDISQLYQPLLTAWITRGLRIPLFLRNPLYSHCFVTSTCKCENWPGSVKFHLLAWKTLDYWNTLNWFSKLTGFKYSTQTFHLSKE